MDVQNRFAGEVDERVPEFLDRTRDALRVVSDETTVRPFQLVVEEAERRTPDPRLLGTRRNNWLLRRIPRGGDTSRMFGVGPHLSSESTCEPTVQPKPREVLRSGRQVPVPARIRIIERAIHAQLRTSDELKADLSRAGLFLVANEGVD